MVEALHTFLTSVASGPVRLRVLARCLELYFQLNPEMMEETTRQIPADKSVRLQWKRFVLTSLLLPGLTESYWIVCGRGGDEASWQVYNEHFPCVKRKDRNDLICFLTGAIEVKDIHAKLAPISAVEKKKQVDWTVSFRLLLQMSHFASFVWYSGTFVSWNTTDRIPKLKPRCISCSLQVFPPSLVMFNLSAC